MIKIMPIMMRESQGRRIFVIQTFVFLQGHVTRAGKTDWSIERTYTLGIDIINEWFRSLLLILMATICSPR